MQKKLSSVNWRANIVICKTPDGKRLNKSFIGAVA